VYTGFYTLLGYLYFYVAALPRAQHLPVKAESGILILLFTVVGVIGAAVAARPSDRYDKRAIVTAGGAIVACALALFVATDSLPLAAVAAGAAGIGWGIFLVADWALACRVLPPGALATTMAIWNLAVVGPQIAAPLLAGALLLKSHILERQNWPRVAFTLAIAEIILEFSGFGVYRGAFRWNKSMEKDTLGATLLIRIALSGKAGRLGSPCLANDKHLTGGFRETTEHRSARHPRSGLLRNHRSSRADFRANAWQHWNQRDCASRCPRDRSGFRISAVRPDSDSLQRPPRI